MWLITVDTLSIALPVTFALALFTFAVPFALCADIIAEHGSENEVLLWRKLVQRTSDDEPDGLQTLTPPEIYVQVLLSGRLQHIWNTLPLQSLYSQFTVLFVAGEQHHVAHTFMQFVDVVHQHLKRCLSLLTLGLNFCGNRCCHSLFF